MPADSGPSSRPPRSGRRSHPIGRPPGTHLAVNVSPSALSTEAVKDVLPDDLSDRDHRADRARGLRRRQPACQLARQPPRARGADRHRRRRRRIRRPEAGHVGPPGHRQARPRADPRDPLRPGPHGAGGIAGPLRAPGGRDRLRGGDREPRRHRGARQPRRALRTGLCDRPARAAVEPGLAARRGDLQGGARQGARLEPRAARPRRSPRATGGWSTSARGSPTPARGRTCTPPST